MTTKATCYTTRGTRCPAGGAHAWERFDSGDNTGDITRCVRCNAVLDDSCTAGAHVDDLGRDAHTNLRVFRVAGPSTEELLRACERAELDGTPQWLLDTPRAELPRLLEYLCETLEPVYFQLVQRTALALLYEQIAAAEARRAELERLLALAAMPAQGRA